MDAAPWRKGTDAARVCWREMHPSAALSTWTACTPCPRCYLDEMVHSKKATIFSARPTAKKRERVGHAAHPEIAAKTKMGMGLRLKRVAKLRAALAKQGPHITLDMRDGDTGDTAQRSLKFGYVTVSNTVPDAVTLGNNVKAGREALGRARTAFTTHGVKLQLKPGIPRFRVDPNNTKLLIREVDGRVDRGSIVGGAFVPAE
jgi:hypothetical protein